MQTYKEALAKFRTEYFLGVLDLHHWKVSEAAKTAGVNRVHLHHVIKSLNLKRAKEEKVQPPQGESS